MAAGHPGIQVRGRAPRLTEGLVGRGYSAPDIKKILGENFLRLFQQTIG